MLTDVVMPDASGIELAKRVESRLPSIKVLFMSGYTDDATARHGLRAPGVHLLEKPFTSSQLLAKLEELLAEGNA
jgi:YesN/AraC family two-component response regulator